MGAADPVRVVVVDDSITMCRFIAASMEADSRVDVVGLATGAQDARSVIKETEPDVVTLDLDMPKVNGLEFLSHIMRLRPMPVVVFSGMVGDRPDIVEKALALGAVSTLAKPMRPSVTAFRELGDHIVRAARGTSEQAQHVPRTNKLVLVGASTGGVTAIEDLLVQWTAKMPPIVIAQHIPQQFMVSFCERLHHITKFNVVVAEAGAMLVPGTVYFASALERQTQVRWCRSHWEIETGPRHADEKHCPSVDRLFASAVPWARQVGAVILTGMGRDGADGLLALRQGGARTIGQSERTCTVYGMPKSAMEAGAVEQEIDLPKIGKALREMMEIAQ